MADEPNQQQIDGNQVAEVTRPDALPEAFWDADAKAPKYADIGTALGELEPLRALKTAAEQRAAGVPADGKYSFDLPKEFKLPDDLGLPADYLATWKVHDAEAAKIAEYAKAKGYSQQEVTEFLGTLALGNAAKKVATAKAEAEAAAEAQKADDEAVKAEAIKVLGSNFMEVSANTRNAMQALFVDKLGKEAGERLAKNIGLQDATDIKLMGQLISALNGSKLATNQGGKVENKSVEFKPGPGAARRLLDQANSQTKN